MKKFLIFLSFWLFLSSFPLPLQAEEENIFVRIAREENREARKFALLVGVTDYGDLQSLQYCVTGVQAVRKELIRLGFKTEDIQMLYSSAEFKFLPTKMNLQKALNRILSQVKEGDLIFFMFSGHGIEKDGAQYLCLPETDRSNLAETAYSIPKLLKKLDDSPAGFKWVVVDACREKVSDSKSANESPLQLITNPPPGIFLFQSCRSGEFSYEPALPPDKLPAGQKPLGIFTESFVEALSGKADSDQDGILTLTEVCKYTTEETGRKAWKFDKTQSPYYELKGSDFILKSDLNRSKAEKCYAEAQRLTRKRDFVAALQEIDKAWKLYPEDPNYLTLQAMLREIVGVLPKDVILALERNENPEVYEKCWEQKVTVREALSSNGKFMAVSCGNDVKILNFNTGETVQTLKGGVDLICSISYSPDGQYLAAGGMGIGGTIVRIWNTRTGECVKTLKGGDSKEFGDTFIFSVSYSPDGRYLAVGGIGTTVQIWDTQTGECVKTLEGHTEVVWSVNYSPDGQFLASGSSDRTIRIWNVPTGACVKTLEGHTSSVNSVIYFPDGRFLASGSGEMEFAGNSDNTIRIWDSQTGECVKTFHGHSEPVWNVNYSPDGQYLVSGGGGFLNGKDSTFRIWNVATGECLSTSEGHSGVVWNVNYSPDGQHLVSGSMDGTVRVWNAAGNCVKTFRGCAVKDVIENDALCYSPDGQYFAIKGCDTVLIWNAQTGECVRTLKGHLGNITSMHYSPDGQYLASSGGHDDKTVRIWDTSSGECVKMLEGHTDDVNFVYYSPDGRFLASGSSDNTVRIWNAQTGECVNTLEGHTDQVRSVSYSPDGRFLASGSHDNTVRIWNVQTGECVKTLETDYLVTFIYYSSNGQYLASISQDGAVRIWDIPSGECVKTLGNTGAIFSPDGWYLASGNEDHTIQIWNIQTGECVKTLKGHTDEISSMYYSPDGRYLVSGSLDQIIRIWDTQTGECIKMLEEHTCGIWSLSYSPDGRFLAVGSLGGLTVWRMK
ncbi:MAG: caspase family protein [Planctomycetia bacterium]|nr:caspase family protein [Planctomycetia bacterium]